MDKLKISLEELENVKQISNEAYDLVTIVVPTNSDKIFKLLIEVYRILRLGGIIEILTPDIDYQDWALFALAEAKFQAITSINYSMNKEINFKDLFGMGAFKFNNANFQFINYKSLIEDTTNWCADLPKDFKCVVGIPRSGMLVATIIAEWLNIPLGTITTSDKLVILSGGSKCTPKSNKGKMLVIDDSINWGKTLVKYKKLFKEQNLEACYGALYYTRQSKHFIDYGFKEVNQLRVFEWNLFHHPILGVSCVDIDGVLSEDPTAEENDDGPKYLKFLKEVKPKYIPTNKIHTLVTCRLEKYREVTEAWLKEHNIIYRKLIMMDYPTREARMKDNKYAIYKADIYRKAADTHLFIESEEWQAEAIAETTGKRTLCVRNMKQFGVEVWKM